MRESVIEKWANNYARELGFYVRKFSTPAHAAAPDDIYALNGRVFFIEYKASLKKLTPLQEHEHVLMKMAGLTVYWTDRKVNAKKIIDSEYARCRL